MSVTESLPARTPDALAAAEIEVALHDGTPLRIRRALPADEPALLGLLERLDVEDRRLRFFTAAANVRTAALAALRATPSDRLDLVAARPDGRIVGHGCLSRIVVDRASRGQAPPRRLARRVGPAPPAPRRARPSRPTRRPRSETTPARACAPRRVRAAAAVSAD